MATYKALTGLDYGNKRVEAGETASDIPANSARWLLEQKLIELVDSKPAPKKIVAYEEEVK